MDTPIKNHLGKKGSLMDMCVHNSGSQALLLGLEMFLLNGHVQIGDL